MVLPKIGTKEKRKILMELKILMSVKDRWQVLLARQIKIVCIKPLAELIWKYVLPDKVFFVKTAVRVLIYILTLITFVILSVFVCMGNLFSDQNRLKKRLIFQ